MKKLCNDCKTSPVAPGTHGLCRKCWDARYRYEKGNTCPLCGVPILNNAKYCHRCNLVQRGFEHIKPCKWCGKDFDYTGHPQVQFCSIHCANSHRYAHIDTAGLFWAKVDKRGSDDCWPWLGSHNGEGYGTFMFRRQCTHAHRVAWILTFGEIPKGKLVCHHCDNRICTNPNHLFIGTDADNNRDMMLKGRNNPPHGERHGMSKLTEKQVAEIRLLADGGISFADIARKFNLGNTTIVSRVVHRETWKHLP